MTTTAKYFTVNTVPTSTNSTHQRVQITPTRFWRWLGEDEFESTIELVASGNFGQVKKAKLRKAKVLKNHSSIYAEHLVALKEPKGIEHNFVEQTYALSHEVSCTVILHPSLVNYIGGVDLGNATSHDPQRLGIVMEFIESNLRKSIELDARLNERRVQLRVAKQIASGISFLHSLIPHVLHRDLRTPNILVNKDLGCKIADFGISKNMSYGEIKPIAMYTSLIPPECKNDEINFTTKGDVYFFGWVLVEMALGRKPESYNILEISKDLKNVLKGEDDICYQELILQCLDENPKVRPTFNEILTLLNYIMGIRYDLELIAQNNSMSLLKEGIAIGEITPQSCDDLGRTIFHQTCIFGNLTMLEFLVRKWGSKHLRRADKYKTTLSHFASRNGYLEILKFLCNRRALSNEKESRFQTSSLDLAVAMKHADCVDFLIFHATRETLDSALLSASAEGQIEVVKKLVESGANLGCRSNDIGATPLDRASYNGHLTVVTYLLEKGAPVNQARPNGVTPLYLACQNKHKAVVETFIHFHANVNQSGNNDVSPLFIASQKGHSEIVQILLDNKADPNFARNDDGTTPLFIASQNGHIKVVSLLLQYGAKVNQSANDTQTPLTISSYRGHIEIVTVLLKYGADVNQRAFGIYSALDNARNHGYQQIIELLQSHSTPSQ